MSYRLYAMDTHFRTPQGLYPFDVRCEMTAQLGYDATYLTTSGEDKWPDVARLKEAKPKFGLDVAAVYVVLQAQLGAEHPQNKRIENLFHTLEGCRNVEIAIRWMTADGRPSDQALDDEACRWLERYLKVCEKRDLNILLYPHINFWLEKIEDAVRLCNRLKHPRLGAMFCGFHWYAADGKDVVGKLDTAGLLLKQVNLCGSRVDVDGHGGKATIEPLDVGDLDNFAILAHLREMKYAGMIGFQGWAMGGDVYSHLRRSINIFKDWEKRLDEHPNWGRLVSRT